MRDVHDILNNFSFDFLTGSVHWIDGWGFAHPDSIKCFGYKPETDMTEYYNRLAVLLNKHHMYAENSGGLNKNL